MIATVGDLRRAIDGIPDEIPLDLDIRMGYLYVDAIDGIIVARRKGRPTCVNIRIEAYLNVEEHDD